MWTVFEKILPFIANIKTTKILKDKISQKRNLDFPSLKVAIENLSEDELSKLYEEDLHWKERLEDKAKTNVVGITIAVTLIMGAYALLRNISEKYHTNVIFWVSFCLFILSVMYMLEAGIHAIHVLTAENMIYYPSLGLKGEEQKKDIDLIIGLNRAQNTLRNNYVYTSYECIKNALICLFVIMIIAIFPVEKVNIQGQSYSYGNFYYSEQAMHTINSGVDKDKVETFINENLINGEFSTVDQTDKLFLKYSIENTNVTVYLVEPID